MNTLPPKQHAPLKGETLEYVIAGQGAPSIVLVNGAGGPIEGWYRVFEPLSTLGRLIAYNRPGIGASSKATRPQTGNVMVDSLRALLSHASLTPPYLLVGHSLGGLIVQLFARTYPAEVAGVVFLDATAPEDVDVMVETRPSLQRTAQRFLDAILSKDEFAESEHVSHTVHLIQQAGSFPPIPIAVVTGAKPAMSWATPARALAARADHQRRLAGLSPLGQQIMATHSGHFPQFTEPDLVVQAVREVANTLKQ